jgi:hypothetical protein
MVRNVHWPGGLEIILLCLRREEIWKVEGGEMCRGRIVQVRKECSGGRDLSRKRMGDFHHELSDRP